MAAPFSIFGKRIAPPAPTTLEANEDSPPLMVQASVQSLSLASPPMSPRETPPGPPAVAPGRPGAPRGFEQVYDDYFGFVWRSVLNRGVPPWGVDDVVQEVFIVVHRKLPEFEGRSSVKTWLSMIVRRVVADHVRKRGNAPAGEALDVEGVSTAAGPAEALDAKAAARVLDTLLAQMSPEQREVFILHEIEEMTGREIAEVSGVNENTVHTRLRAARRIFEEGIARLRD
jgi:RNA polymerase sigma-70 factor, ECF subfamily